MFDLYDAVGTPLQRVSRIFSFATDDAYPVNPAIQERIMVDTSTNNYTFEQLLVENETLLSYRDYNRQTTDYWYNTEHGLLYIWDNTGECWSAKQHTDNTLIKPIVNNSQPLNPWDSIDGLLWFSPPNIS